MADVTFDFLSFTTRYPEFVGIAQDTLASLFDEASNLYLDNTDNSIVQDESRRQYLLYLLTAHLAALSGLVTKDGQPRAVGRISSATQGSVTVAMEYLPPGSQSWYVQTQYGASYWEATSALRGFEYIPASWQPY